MSIDHEARVCADLVKSGDTKALSAKLVEDSTVDPVGFNRLLQQIQADNA